MSSVRPTPSPVWTGSCHCGGVVFRFESALESPFRCNCSYCRRRGAIVQKVPAEKFSILEGEDLLRSYGNRTFSKHAFCSSCGINVFTRITRENEASVAVNLACAAEIDLTGLTPREFDGANLL